MLTYKVLQEFTAEKYDAIATINAFLHQVECGELNVSEEAIQDAMDLRDDHMDWLKGVEHLHKFFLKKEMKKAETVFEKAKKKFLECSFP